MHTNHKVYKDQSNGTILTITGLIQGVGFRPFVYRLANRFMLYGKVFNQNNGVVIYLQGNPAQIEEFILSLSTDAPSAASIKNIEKKVELMPKFTEFSIEDSRSINESITQVSPDIAVCDDCLTDMENQIHRIDYPFVNCTHCGPRFSIIETIPYDRLNTSMKDFSLCSTCSGEYHDMTDRRFHAQPVACNQCGPHYTLFEGNDEISDYTRILHRVKELIENQGVVALKGLGGYHLVCDAFSKESLLALRKIKVRDGKPFAIMANNLETIKQFAQITDEEILLLNSWQRPIVVVKAKRNDSFPSELTNGINTLGFFLPYLPIHYQLFKEFKSRVLVFTSGNVADNPIITSNSLALNSFQTKLSAVVTHNRDIVNRVDDSVVKLIGGKKILIRRARGYAPSPVYLNFDTEGILATGAELSNAFCIGKEKQAVLSQHIGDLKNYETMQFFESSLKTMSKLFRFTAEKIVCDLHPTYLSTQFAENLGKPVIYAQHHHAHIAACMAEYGIDEPVIGVCYDGTGFGTDRKNWGSEILICDYVQFERKFHFRYLPLPGGDAVISEPWRSSVSYLTNSFEDDSWKKLNFLKKIPEDKLEKVILAVTKRINTSESCSAGRLFDAVAGILNVCTHAGYNAEAPVRLENEIVQGSNEIYPIELKPIIDWSPVIRYIVEDVQRKISTSVIASKFHNTISSITEKAIRRLHEETGIKKIILSGGTFQNNYLTEKLLDLLNNLKLEVYIARQVPFNDGGIALGQLAIAAHTN